MVSTTQGSIYVCTTYLNLKKKLNLGYFFIDLSVTGRLVRVNTSIDKNTAGRDHHSTARGTHFYKIGIQIFET